MGTNGDRQEQKGTDRDRKGLSLLISEKSRDITGTKSAKTEQGQNRGKKGQLGREKNRDKPSRDNQE